MYICIVKISLLISFLILLVISQSCKKQREKNIQVSKDYALYQTDLSTILPLIIHCTKNKSYFNQVLENQEDTLNTCASFSLVNGDTADISNGIIEFNIIFDNCLDKDGFTKNGEIVAKLFNYSESTGGNVLLTFSDFMIGESKLKGSISITRLSNNNYRIATSNFSITKEGKKIVYDAFLNYIISPNSDADDLFDNHITVSDSDAFINRSGDEYQILNKELFRSMNCSYFSKGKIEIVDEKNTTQVLDFGNGSCDGVATVTYDEDIFTFTIK
jgi:hypothetical protein